MHKTDEKMKTMKQEMMNNIKLLIKNKDKYGN